MKMGTKQHRCLKLTNSWAFDFLLPKMLLVGFLLYHHKHQYDFQNEVQQYVLQQYLLQKIRDGFPVWLLEIMSESSVFMYDMAIAHDLLLRPYYMSEIFIGTGYPRYMQIRHKSVDFML